MVFKKHTWYCRGDDDHELDGNGTQQESAQGAEPSWGRSALQSQPCVCEEAMPGGGGALLRGAAPRQALHGMPCSVGARLRWMAIDDAIKGGVSLLLDRQPRVMRGSFMLSCKRCGCCVGVQGGVRCRRNVLCLAWRDTPRLQYM